MSGVSSRLPYDICAFSQKTKTSCSPGDYSLFLEYNINPNLRTAKDVPCLNSDKSIGCQPCNLNENPTDKTLEIGPNSFVLKAAIEDDLNGLTRNLTKCASEKYLSCEINNPHRKPGECDNVIAVTPLLCDRSIVPTNLKFPTSKGF